MSEPLSDQVDTNSLEFKEGVEAGLNSAEDTKNWQAGNELGLELKDEVVVRSQPAAASVVPECPTPLFLKDNPEGSKHNPQDEKDSTEE